MQIQLQNVPKKLKPVEIKSALEFYANVLMKKNLHKNIMLRVCFNNAGENTTCWEDDHLRPREFTINICSRMGYQNIFLTLAHEMVHVKQYAMGELRDVMRGPTPQRWLNAPIDSDNIEYWDLPWEIEAYGREKGLYFRFRAAKNK
jgi:hypothetical protein